MMKVSIVIRIQRKIRAAIMNVREFLRTQDETRSFIPYLWDFFGEAPLVNAWSSISQLPSTTPESVAMSVGLKKGDFVLLEQQFVKLSCKRCVW